MVALINPVKRIPFKEPYITLREAGEDEGFPGDPPGLRCFENPGTSQFPQSFSLVLSRGWGHLGVGNGGMDPYSSPYKIIPNISPQHPCPHSLLSTREFFLELGNLPCFWYHYSIL